MKILKLHWFRKVEPGEGELDTGLDLPQFTLTEFEEKFAQGLRNDVTKIVDTYYQLHY